jgi:transposase-like protein
MANYYKPGNPRPQTVQGYCKLCKHLVTFRVGGRRDDPTYKCQRCTHEFSVMEL